MFGNPVRIGDGYATVTNDKLSNSHWHLAGKAGARLAVRSQETGLVALVEAVEVWQPLLREEKDEASPSLERVRRMFAFILRFAGCEGFLLSGPHWSLWKTRCALIMRGTEDQNACGQRLLFRSC